MEFREAAVGFKRFEANNKARIVAELEHTIRAFESLANDLDRQVAAEEERKGVKDPTHIAYSTFARAASQRRDNLRASVAGLKTKLEVTQRERERDDALEQLARVDAPAVKPVGSAREPDAPMPSSASARGASRDDRQSSKDAAAD
jgi:flagellar FliJ protein